MDNSHRSYRVAVESTDRCSLGICRLDLTRFASHISCQSISHCKSFPLFSSSRCHRQIPFDLRRSRRCPLLYLL